MSPLPTDRSHWLTIFKKGDAMSGICTTTINLTEIGGFQDRPQFGGGLEILRLGSNETALRLFTPDAVPVSLHYLNDPPFNGYLHCGGEDCPLCQAGVRREERLLLPVYDMAARAVRVLPVSKNSSPGALLPQLQRATGVNGEDLGTPTFTYSYTDDDGNVVTSTSPPVDPGYYTVTASFAGSANYLPASATATIMIAYDARTLTDLSRAFNAGRTIPIKIQLLDSSGNNLSSSGIDLTAVRLERVNADGSVTQVTLQDAGNANPGNLFRYDASLDGYIFNLSTRGLGAGTYHFYWIADGDPTEHELSFRLV
jgi:hypothetical protein